MAAEVIGAVSLELLLDTEKFNKSVLGLNKLIENNLTKSFSTLEKTMARMEKTMAGLEKEAMKTQQTKAKAYAQIVSSVERTKQSTNRLRAAQEKTTQSANNLKRSYANIKSTSNYAYSQALKNVGKLIERQNILLRSSKNIGSKATWSGMLTSLSSGVYLAKNLYTALDRTVQKIKEVADIGGQLVETQNVIDTKLGTSAGSVSAWALSDTTKDTFGMNALTSSEFAARFGGMMTTSGFSDEISGEYAKILSGLVADESSLWNKGYDDTFSAFMSGIFGNTTRAMKNYAVDLSVASLQEYALAEGIEKSYYAMTNQEKLCLKISKTIKTLTGDVGDFARTQNTWANQTRMLSENFEQLKMTIGQGLIVALTPVVKIINTILERLITLAAYFKNFMISIFGDDALQSGFAQWGEDLENFEDAAQDTASGVEKAFKSMFLPIDDIVQLNKKDSSSGSGSIGSGIDQAFLDLLEPGMYDKLYKKWEEMEQESSAWLIRLTQETEGLWGAINKFKGFMKSEDGLPRFLQICKDFANNIDWEKINTSLDNFWESAEPVAELAWDGLMDFYEYFLAPLGNWVLNEGLTSLLDILTKFNTDIDWERINTSLENFWKALEPKVEAIGRGFIDFLNDLADWAIKFINDNCPAALDAVTNFLNETDDSKFEKLGYGIGVVATAFLGLKLALDGLAPLLSVGATVMGWATNSSLLGGVSGTAGAATTTGGASATGGAGLVATLTEGSITGLSGTAALGAGAGAVAVIAAGITMIVKGIDDLWTKVPQFKEDMLEILSDIGESFGEFWTTIKNSFGILGESFSELFESLGLSTQQITGLWGTLEFFFGGFQTLLDFILSIVGHTIEYIAIQLSNVVQIIQGVLQVIFGIVSLDGQKIMDGLSNICSGFTDLLIQTFTTGLNYILDVVEAFIGVIGNIGEPFSEGFKNSFLQGWENIKQTIWDSIGGFAIDVQNWLNKTFGLNLDFASNMPTSESSGGNSFKTLNAATNMYNPQMQRLSTSSWASSNMKTPYSGSSQGGAMLGSARQQASSNYQQPIVIHNYVDVDGETMAQNVNTFNAKLNNK